MVLSHGSVLAVTMLLTLFSSGSHAATSVQGPGETSDPAPARGEYVYTANYSRDGELLALAQANRPEAKGEHTILLFETRAWKQRFKLTGPTDACFGVAFSADGAKLFAACTDGLVYSWDTASGVPGPKLDAGAGPCQGVVLSPDGKSLVTGHDDPRREPARSSIHVWDAATGKPLRAISPDVLVSANSLTFTPDGGRIAGCGVDPRAGEDFSGVIEWDLATGEERRRYAAVQVTPGAHVFAHAIAYTRDGKWLIVGGGETVSNPAFPNASDLFGYVWLLDRASGRLEKTLVDKRHDHVRLLRLSPDESRLYVSTHSIPREVAEQGRIVERTFDELQCWDTGTWELKWLNVSEPTTDWALLASPDGWRIGTSTAVGFYFFDPQTGDPKGGLIYSRRD